MRRFELPAGLLETAVAVFPEIGDRIAAENNTIRQRRDKPTDTIISPMRQSIIAANHLYDIGKGSTPPNWSATERGLYQTTAALLEQEFKNAKRESNFWT